MGKEQLVLVKERNKKLCKIMMSGEMKEKAEILVEAEKLRKVKDELSEELQDLHIQLEQERSKVIEGLSEKRVEDLVQHCTGSRFTL